MKRKVFAIAGGILLGFVAVFTLISALKAAIGLAILAFAGRGLLRLWGSASHRAPYVSQQDAYPGLGEGAPHAAVQNLQPAYGAPKQQGGIIPIW